MAKKKTQVPWTTSEIRALRRLAEEKKMGAALIHRSGLLYRHSKNGIQAKMSELCLGQPKSRQRAKEAKRMRRDERDKLLTFLTGDGKEMPSREVAGLLEVRAGTVTYYRRKLGIKLSGKLRFSSGVFRETHSHLPAKMGVALRLHREQFWQNRRGQLIRQLQRDALHNCVSRFLQCKSCGERWPPNRRYFYLGRRVEGVQEIQACCRACGRSLWGKRLKANV